MTALQRAVILRYYRLALVPGAPPYVLMPGSTSFDSRGP